MTGTPLAYCDRPRGRHVLARLSAIDGAAGVEASVALLERKKTRTSEVDHQSARWGFFPLDGEAVTDGENAIPVYCAQCRRSFVLSIAQALRTHADGHPPLTLRHTPNR